MSIKKTTYLLCSATFLCGSVFATSPAQPIEKIKAPKELSAKAQIQIQIQNPATLLQNSIVVTQEQLIASKDKFSHNPKALITLIDTQVMPLLATNIIAQILIGQTRWNSASKNEQGTFIREITQMLAYSYAKNIAQAGNYKIKINAFDKNNNSWKKSTLVVVTGRIINVQNNEGSDLAIKMLLVNAKSTHPEWKVYDLSVAGVSILSNFRAQFKDYKTLNDINLAIEKKNNELIHKKSK